MSTTVNLNLRLSPSFTLREAIRSQTACRRGIENMPTGEQAAGIVRVATEILQPCRDHFQIPITPSSWFRCQELNRAIGSKDASQHCKAEAVDFEVLGVSNLVLAKYIANNLDFDQLILEYWTPDDPSSGWIHTSYVNAETNRREILRFDGERYLPGLE